MIRSGSGHPLLESFAIADRAASILLDACGAGSAWSHGQASAGLAGCSSLDVVRSLGHADSRTRLKLLNRLPIPEANCCLILIQGLLVSAVLILLVLLLLLVHVSILEEAASRACVGGVARGSRGARLLNFV